MQDRSGILSRLSLLRPADTELKFCIRNENFFPKSRKAYIHAASVSGPGHQLQSLFHAYSKCCATAPPFCHLGSLIFIHSDQCAFFSSGRIDILARGSRSPLFICRFTVSEQQAAIRRKLEALLDAWSSQCGDPFLSLCLCCQNRIGVTAVDIELNCSHLGIFDRKHSVQGRNPKNCLDRHGGRIDGSRPVDRY